MSTIYSFLDTAFSITPAAAYPPLVSAGEIGFDKATVTMDIEKTEMDVAADGGVMISAKAGRTGKVTLEFQQTSFMYTYLVGLLNLLEQLMLNNNVKNWATTTLLLRNIADGTSHICTGVALSKMSDKPYTAQGQHITWILHCADIQTISIPTPQQTV